MWPTSKAKCLPDLNNNKLDFKKIFEGHIKIIDTIIGYMHMCPKDGKNRPWANKTFLYSFF